MWVRRRSGMLLAICGLLASACVDDAAPREEHESSDEPSAEMSDADGAAQTEDDADAGDVIDASADGGGRIKPDDAGARLFDPTRVAEMRFEVGDDGLAQLRADADERMGFEDFTYVAAKLTYDGTVYGEVALRVKGNNSRTTAKGDAVPFKVDMNEYVDGQELDGQTKINLHNNGNQAHGMSDYLSYAAFREADVAASRTGWADVYLNGQKLGLYTVVEQVDDAMLARWYEQPEGALYKPEPQSGFLAYAGDSFDDYPTASYEANDEDTDHATFLRVVKTVDEEPVSAWDAVIDVESVLQYLAGNVALGNWDTYVSMGHNYYLFEATPGRMVMLPWDMNLSQASGGAVCASELRMGGGMPGGFGGTRPTPPSDVGGGFPGGGAFPGGGGGPTGGRSAPLYDGLMQDPTTFARYLEVLGAFLAGPGSADALLANLAIAQHAVGDRITTSAIEALRTTIRTRVATLEAAIPSTTMCAASGSAQP
ncbi:MAG: CotH kinase family protein [Polyangiales bacterium]